MKALCLKPLNIVFEEGRLYEYAPRKTPSTTPSPTASPSPSESASSSDYVISDYVIITAKIGYTFQNDVMDSLGIKNRVGIYDYLKGMRGVTLEMDFALDEYIITTELDEEKFHKHFRKFI